MTMSVLHSPTGNVLQKLEFFVTPQPILRPGDSAKLLCTTGYEMLHSAEIYDASHNDTLALSHGERSLRLAAVVSSQQVSHTCYMCVARDHSGNLLTKKDLCVEVVAGDGKLCLHLVVAFIEFQSFELA